MSRTHHRVLGASAGLVAGLCLVAAPTPAEAAHPLKNTTYRGSGGQEGLVDAATFTLKVAGNTSRIKKAVVKVTCPAGTLKVVFKNVEVDDHGNFYKVSYYPGTTAPRYQFGGTFRSRHKADVDFDPRETGEPCGTYVMEGSVHD